MSALTRYFFSPVYVPRTSWSIVGWWERRRPVYNLVLAVAGVLSLGAHRLFSALPPSAASPDEPLGLVGVLAYGVLANLCYTTGPAVDVYIRRRWGDEYAVVGPTLLRYGFVFSVGLTLLPIPVSFLTWALRLLRLGS